MLTVRELRQLVHRLKAPEFKRQMGPFALIQKPPDEMLAKVSMMLGARQTMMRPRGQRGADPAHAFIFEFEQMEVATLPPLEEVTDLSVGRLPDCDLVIDDPSVSKKHAILRWDDLQKRAFLTDLGSTNGTLLNGESMWEPEVALKDWDLVSFGDAQFCFALTDTLYTRLLSLPK